MEKKDRRKLDETTLERVAAGQIVDVLFERMTDIQVQIAQMIMMDYSLKEIAASLGVSKRNVSVHVRKMRPLAAPLFYEGLIKTGSR